MKKEKTTNSAKETVLATAEKVLKVTEETAEAAIKKASEVVNKENVEKTIDAVKETAKAVKSRAKTATETTKKRTTTKKIQPKIFIQYFGKEVNDQVILDKFYEEWKKDHNLAEIKDLKLYYKVEEDTAYFLVNDSVTVTVKLV